MRYGPNFFNELKAAGLAGLPFSWNEVTGEVWADQLTPVQREALNRVIAAHDPKKPDTTKPVVIYWADIFRKMTDAEADTWDTVVKSQPKRKQWIITKSLHIQTDDALYPELYGAMVQAYGEVRTLQLLAPNS